MASEKDTDIRKFLVVVDETPECRVAIYYASRRARRTGGLVSLLYVIRPADFQHWQAVADVMVEEAREEAERILHDVAAEVMEVSGRMPEMIIRDGKTREQIQQLIKEDPAIKILVLGAATGSKNPGPLISAIATGGFVEDPEMRLIPLTIVPGSLRKEDIDQLT